MVHIVNKEVIDYLATLKKEAETQKALFYKELFTPRKEYGFKIDKKEKTCQNSEV